ncbi:hypothetical protein NX059_005566 [Plenodomus lindquistii]|nr:hypothetical protein NX059_005566 [Plenodomus lindquistii]
MPCRHPDIRTFDNVLCCLSCGEEVPTDAVSDVRTTQYEYRHLDHQNGREIRLIVFPGKDDEVLNCDIVHADLDNKPVYEAISCTWATETGDAQRYQIAYCRGRSVHITKNCESALKAVRQQYRRRTVWIDAICIDQIHVEERNRQVNLMSSIYQTASQVLAYLGPGTTETRPALYRVMSLLETMSLKGNVEYPQSYDMRDDIRTLLQLLYFDRVWFLQELALVKLVTLLAGNKKIAWTAVTAGSRRAIRRREGFWRSFREAGTAQPEIRETKSSLSLAWWSRKLKDALLVDYSLPPLELFTMVATHLLLSRESVEVLKHTSNQFLDSSSVPTWVPLWDIKDVYQPLPSQFTPLEMHALAFLFFVKVETGYEIRATALASEANEADINTVEVCKRTKILERQHEEAFDRLPCPSPVLHSLRVRAHLLDVVIQMPTHPILNALNLKASSQHPSASVILYSSCLNHKFTPCRPSLDIAIEWSNSIKSAFNRIGRWNSTDWTDHPSDGRHSVQIMFEEDSYGYSLDINGIVFETEHSIGPTRRCARYELMQVGDTIWALAGVDVPFVLRKVDTHYEIIGECYLHRAALDLPCACCGKDARPWPILTETIEIW